MLARAIRRHRVPVLGRNVTPYLADFFSKRLLGCGRKRLFANPLFDRQTLRLGLGAERRLFVRPKINGGVMTVFLLVISFSVKHLARFVTLSASGVTLCEPLTAKPPSPYFTSIAGV